MTAANSLDEIYEKSARDFLQTVLVIDNELTFGTPAKVAPVEATVSPSNSVRSGTRLGDEILLAPQPTTDQDWDSPLDAQRITDAFLKKAMVCGLYRPRPQEDPTEQAIALAAKADALIIDWRLVGNDSTKAKDIIEGVLKQDSEEHGRLRLIVVYTSDPNVDGVLTDLAARLGAYGLSRDETALVKPDTRICVLNKEETVGAQAPVATDELPNRMVSEFKFLTSGLLRAFAVGSIARIRSRTHHVLSVFSSDFDGAFISHRIASVPPEVATDFAVDLVLGEFRTSMSDPKLHDIIGPNSIKLWLAHSTSQKPFKFKDSELPVEDLKSLVDSAGGEQGLKEWKKQVSKGIIDLIGGIKVNKIHDLFYENNIDSRNALEGLAVLSSLEFDIMRAHGIRSTHAPMLTMGTLILAHSKEGQPETNDQYLICVQPKCDSIRLTAPRQFPFQKCSVVQGDGAFNIVVPKRNPDGTFIRIRLLANGLPYMGRLIEFGPSTGSGIIAEANNDGHFLFKDTSSQTYTWIGQLRELNAQHLASQVAGRYQTPGLNEFEWLRLSKPR